MKKIFSITLILFTICFTGFTQNKTAITLDLGGMGGLYTLNGEYEIGKFKSNRINLHLGFGYAKVDGVQYIGAPVGLNLISGEKNHHLELGLGASYIHGLVVYGKKFEDEGIYFAPTIGYRYDKFQKGWLFKIYYSPMFALHDFFNKEKFLNEVVPPFYGNWTKEEYYNQMYGGRATYPTIKNDFANFGLSIGYRF
ncbi:MAG: hypothetical protein ACOYOT_06635 [Bacteroidales bacterium]